MLAVHVDTIKETVVCIIKLYLRTKRLCIFGPKSAIQIRLLLILLLLLLLLLLK